MNVELEMIGRHPLSDFCDTFFEPIHGSRYIAATTMYVQLSVVGERVQIHIVLRCDVSKVRCVEYE